MAKSEASVSTSNGTSSSMAQGAPKGDADVLDLPDVQWSSGKIQWNCMESCYYGSEDLWPSNNPLARSTSGCTAFFTFSAVHCY